MLVVGAPVGPAHDDGDGVVMFPLSSFPPESGVQALRLPWRRHRFVRVGDLGAVPEGALPLVAQLVADRLVAGGEVVVVGRGERELCLTTLLVAAGLEHVRQDDATRLRRREAPPGVVSEAYSRLRAVRPSSPPSPTGEVEVELATGAITASAGSDADAPQARVVVRAHGRVVRTLVAPTPVTPSTVRRRAGVGGDSLWDPSSTVTGVTPRPDVVAFVTPSGAGWPPPPASVGPDGWIVFAPHALSARCRRRIQAAIALDSAAEIDALVGTVAPRSLPSTATARWLLYDRLAAPTVDDDEATCMRRVAASQVAAIRAERVTIRASSVAASDAARVVGQVIADGGAVRVSPGLVVVGPSHGRRALWRELHGAATRLGHMERILGRPLGRAVGPATAQMADDAGLVRAPLHLQLAMALAQRRARVG